MVTVHSKALNSDLQVSRIIGELSGKEEGPCLIFIGGVHGNEPSGVFALQQVFEELQSQKVPIKGKIIGLSGNLWALERGERFHKQDLNRLWDENRTEQLKKGVFIPNNEDEKQQLELFTLIQSILSSNKGPFYFFDLHTTSSKTQPFMTVNDSLLNRYFTKQYPIHSILGIEEYLNGPLLSYINELGYVSFGFEGGQHNSLASIENHRAFVYLSLAFSGSVLKEHIDYETHLRTLKIRNPGVFEIYHRHKVASNETFQMLPGFNNFQSVSKGEKLAISNETTIIAASESTIFMPLYQAKGEDGFFLIREIPQFFLWLSGVFRRWRIDKLLPLLPGVNWVSKEKSTMTINLVVARFLAKQFLHLMGYRSKVVDKNHLIVKSREAASKTEEYHDSGWLN